MSQVNAPVSMETASIGTVSLGVGIDTARYGHHVSFLDEQKRSRRGGPSRFTSPNRRREINSSKRSCRSWRKNIREFTFTFGWMPPGSLPRTWCSGCIGCRSAPRSPWDSRHATKRTAKFTLTSVKPIPWRAWRVLDSSAAADRTARRHAAQSAGIPATPRCRRSDGVFGQAADAVDQPTAGAV